MNKAIPRYLVGWEVRMPDKLLVKFVMSGGEDKTPPQDERWERIRAIPGVSFVLKTTTMGTYEGEFRVKGEEAMEALRQEGEVAIIKE